MDFIAAMYRPDVAGRSVLYRRCRCARSTAGKVS